MSAVLAGSPAPVHAASFKSPLRNFRPEACERVATEQVYADSHANVVQWRKEFLSAASFEAQQGLRELRHEQEHLKDLQSGLAGIQSLVQVASHLQNGGARLTEVLNSSGDAAATRAHAIARISDDLRECCQRQQVELQKEERKRELQRELADKQHGEAIKLLNVYKDRLGLEITRVAQQTVRMSFSLIDEADLSKEFSFTLGIADSAETKMGGYSVKECTPHVPELPKLLEELNAEVSSPSSLPRFVCSMRRAFVKSARTANEP